jgi:hypothetical protein
MHAIASISSVFGGLRSISTTKMLQLSAFMRCGEIHALRPVRHRDINRGGEVSCRHDTSPPPRPTKGRFLLSLNAANVTGRGESGH